MRQLVPLTVYRRSDKAAMITRFLTLNSVHQFIMASAYSDTLSLRTLFASISTDPANVLRLAGGECDTEKCAKTSPVPSLVKHTVALVDRISCVFFHSVIG